MKSRLTPNQYLWIPFFILASISQAQAPLFSVKSSFSVPLPKERTCHTTIVEQKLQEKFPDRATEEEFEARISHLLEARSTQRTLGDEIYYIPTIIHIVHNGETIGSGSNISNEQIMSQFDVLNEDFRRTGNGSNDHPDGADIGIEFYPALTDPDGNTLSEPGVDRINGQQEFWEEDEINTSLKPDTYWDPENYLNIWVVNFGGNSSEYLGYAQFPSLSGLDGLDDDEGGEETDGVVIGYQFFGNTGNVSSPFDLGRTTTHEVGHWLGLRHIWGDGGCSDDDYCTDTPPAGESNTGCSENDSCPEDDLMDMIENYMDYTDDACMNIFTQDQKSRMRVVMENALRRQSLLNAQCGNAETINAGTITTEQRGWYAYTATSETLLNISSIDQTSENTLVRIHGSCNSLPIIASDDSFDTEQSEVSVLVDAEETVYIYWTIIDSEESFDWTLTELSATEGGACGLASTATIGTNNMPDTDLNEYWFAYTESNANQKLLINYGGHFRVYRGDCDELSLDWEESSQLTLTDVNQSEIIYIVLEPDGINTELTLTSEDLAEGEGCSTAVEASLGTNTTLAASYWYTFSTTEYGYYTLSSTELTDIATSLSIYDSCNGSLLANDEDDESEQSEITLILEESEQIKIHWENLTSTDGFSWELSFEQVPPGEDCENPEIVTIGDQQFSTSDDIYWTKYEVQNSDKKLVVTADEDADIYIFDSCELEVLYGYGTGSVSATSLISGQEVIIIWDLTYVNLPITVNYTISEEDLVQGDLCNDPIAISPGTIETTRFPQWFAYTSTDEQTIKISSIGTTNYDTFLNLYEACDDDPFVEEDDSQNTLQSEYSLTLEAGETVLINWGNNYSSEPFNWTLEEVTPEEGSICGTAMDVGEGEYESTAPFWYHFTMPVTGTVIISSAGLNNNQDVDTELIVYESCDGETIAYSDDFENTLESKVVLELHENDEIIFQWTDEYWSDSFNWVIQIDELLGEALAQGVIYPNPTSDQVYVNASKPVRNIQVLEVSGKMLIETTESVLDLSEFRDGIYFIRIQYQEGESIHRIRVEK